MPNDTTLRSRTVSVRLDGELFDRLVTIAKVKGTTMGAVIRDAIDQHAKSLMSDPAWVEEVEDLQRRLAPLLPPKQ
ncbi:hypothetical protein [Actinomyces dentalis]|jgi:hypothetical protein|uniref:hypothetical protein n=1 Tax=Actinomyces dentalis TaxID=272548 RepID=UPI0023544263|nr:hypothetical protein [Actinomyces dentalis]